MSVGDSSGIPDVANNVSDVTSDDGPNEESPAAPTYGLDTRPANPTCLAPARPVLATDVALQQLWPGVAFGAPVVMAQAPGDNDTFYILDRDGRILRFPSTTTKTADVQTMLTIPVNESGEGGFLGIAFHPSWQTNHQMYLFYTRNTAVGDPPFPPQCVGGAPSYTSVIARTTSTDGGNTLGAPDELIKLGKPFINHNGGNLLFGPDGMLYVGIGDGGSGNDPCGSGQRLDTMFGKVLRIDVNAGAGAYKVPPDNPFVGTPNAEPTIWSYGHRNPWRWSFDRGTGDLWLGEVGQDTWEEIDRIRKGGNYGWNTCEGLHKLGSTTDVCQTPGLIDPIVEHPRSEAQAIVGGYVYRGSAMPWLVGTYIYGDYITGNIWALTYDASNKPVPKVIATVPSHTLVSFAEGNDGELYLVWVQSLIWKLVPNATPPPPDTFPKLLSATGCVDPKDATKPVDAMIPYDVVSPLWSDGAAKERYVAIPDGTTITVGADNDWDLPKGSVAMKTFSVGGKRVETRLFMRHSDGGWAGYSYEWNDQGTDAVLLPAGKVKTVGAQSWTYPSRTQCIQCHSDAAGGTIGLETWQLNKDSAYPSTGRTANQLATLDHIGMFSAPLGATPDKLPRLPDPAGTEPLDGRARSYLHANCAHCHRPNGGGQGTMDLRFGQTFPATNTCNAVNTQGPVGPATKIIVPGNASMSSMSLRIHATDSKRMPPVAVSIVDPLGSKLVDDWIDALGGCP